MYEVKSKIRGVKIYFDLSKYIVKDKRDNVICLFSYENGYKADIKLPIDVLLLDKLQSFMDEYTTPPAPRTGPRTEFFPWENQYTGDIPDVDDVWKSYKENIVDKKTEMFLEVLDNFRREAEVEGFIPTPERPTQYPMIDINIIKK